MNGVTEVCAGCLQPRGRCNCPGGGIWGVAELAPAQALPLIDGPEGLRRSTHDELTFTEVFGCTPIAGDPIQTAAVGSPSLIPELPDSFSNAMAKVESLRLTRRTELERRDRAEWECFVHFACENSLFKRQAS